MPGLHAGLLARSPSPAPGAARPPSPPGHAGLGAPTQDGPVDGTGQERRGRETEKVPLSRRRRGLAGWALGSLLSVNDCAPRGPPAHRDQA